MDSNIKEIAGKADKLVQRLGSRDARQIAKELGIDIIPCGFKTQKGAYKVVLNNRFIFINSNLKSPMDEIVILHEVAHDILHRSEAVQMGGMYEVSLFSNLDMRMEYEANVFAAQIMLPDEELLGYIDMGYDASQIAAAMRTDVNLVAIKLDIMSAKGYKFNKLDNKKDFLK